MIGREIALHPPLHIHLYFKVRTALTFTLYLVFLFNFRFDPYLCFFDYMTICPLACSHYDDVVQTIVRNSAHDQQDLQESLPVSSRGLVLNVTS